MNGAELVWGDASPTAPGWWWVRSPRGAIGVAVVYRTTTDGRFFAAEQSGGGYVGSAPYAGYSWAGPIPEPREATDAED